MKVQPVRPFTKLLQSSKGFSLVEIIVALGLVTLVSLGSVALVNIVQKQQYSAEAKKEIIAAALVFKRTLGRYDETGLVCKNALSVSSSFDPRGRTSVQFNFSEGVYKAGATIPGVPQVMVDNLYLADSTLVSQSSTSKTYVSTVFFDSTVTVAGMRSQQRTRPLATILLELDNSNAVISCNMKVSLADSKTNCEAIAGTVWNEMAQACQADVPRNGNQFVDCPGGLIKDSAGICRPAANNCAGGTVARSFDHSIVQSCSPPPPNYFVAARPAPAPAPVVAEGSAPPPEVSTAPFVPVATGPTVNIPGAGASAGGGNCSGSNVVGQTLIEQCMADPACVMPNTPPVQSATRAACSTSNSTAYTTPAIASNPPVDPAPPVTNTCVCGSYRIDGALNERCMTCRYKDSGFIGTGQKTYYYEGSYCENGNLVPMAIYKTQNDPGGSHMNCKNKLWRGVCPGGGNCRQYYNDPGF